MKKLFVSLIVGAIACNAHAYTDNDLATCAVLSAKLNRHSIEIKRWDNEIFKSVSEFYPKDNTKFAKAHSNDLKTIATLQLGLDWCSVHYKSNINSVFRCQFGDGILTATAEFLVQKYNSRCKPIATTLDLYKPETIAE